MRDRLFWLTMLVYFGHFAIYVLVSAMVWAVRAPFRFGRWYTALRQKRAEKRDARRAAALLARKGWRFKDWTPSGPLDPRPSGPPPSNS